MIRYRVFETRTKAVRDKMTVGRGNPRTKPWSSERETMMITGEAMGAATRSREDGLGARGPWTTWADCWARDSLQIPFILLVPLPPLN